MTAHRAKAARTIARRTGARAHAVAATAAARAAMLAACECQRSCRPRKCLIEPQLHGLMQIGAALGRPRPCTPRAEDFGEQIAKRGRVIDAARREIESLESAAVPGVLRVSHEPQVVP